jgi:hypothetical protein
VGPERSKITERPCVPTLTTGPDRDPSTSPPEATKIAWGFGKQVVEGGGDAFFKKKANKETPAYRSLDHATTSTKVQSRCARVTLYRGGGGISPHQSQVWLIGIKPCLRGATIGDTERGP